MQTAFELPTASAPVTDVPVAEPGSYATPEPLTLTALQEALATARAALPGLPVQLAKLFELGLAETERSLYLRLDQREHRFDEAMRLFDVSFEMTQEEYNDFVARLPALALAVAGLAYRLRNQRTYKSFVVWVPGVGSLEGNAYDDGTCRCEFDAQRSPALLPRYYDESPQFEVPEAVWREGMCLAALCETKGRPSIRPISHGGRLYALNGASHCGPRSEGHGWALAPREAWKGAVCSQEELHEAYDNGDRFRGDMRGLLVAVRGVEFVFAEYAVFIDNNTYASRATQALVGEQFEQPALSELGDDEHEDLDGEVDDDQLDASEDDEPFYPVRPAPKMTGRGHRMRAAPQAQMDLFG